MTYGVSEIRIDKNENIESAKRKIVSIILDLRWRQLMDNNTIYSIDDFHFRTLPEYLTPNNKDYIPRERSEILRKTFKNGLDNSIFDEDTPGNGFLFKEFLSNNLINIDSLKQYYKEHDMKICDLFSYKNKVLIEISFRAIFKDVEFIKKQALIDKFKRERKMLQALEEYEDNSNKTYKSDDDDSVDSDGECEHMNDINRKALLDSIKVNARAGSEFNKNKIFGELPDIRIRGSF